MEIRDKVVVVTGGASGIGRALCERFAGEGAARVVVSDVDADGARAVADAIGGQALQADVGVEAEVQALVQRVLSEHGRVDLYCSNAGVAGEPGLGSSNQAWQSIFDINVMAHVFAARALLPPMLERGQGRFLITASAAGLLTMIGAAPYSVTKHAAVAFAEWLSIHYGDAGIGVSCLCPQGVRTGMLNESTGPSFLMLGALEPADVAQVVIDALRDERFLILPHPEVKKYEGHRASDRDRWLASMRKLKKTLEELNGGPLFGEGL